MKEIFSLLLDNAFGNSRPLFLSQHALAKEIVANNNSKYYIDQAEQPEDYKRAVSKLQTYISLLINDQGGRKLRQEFIDAVVEVVKCRRDDNYLISDDDILKIRKAFETHLDRYVQPQFDKLGLEYLRLRRTAAYIANFISRPIELEAHPEGPLLIIRDLVIDSLVDVFSQIRVQKHRYNLPKYNTCIIFWRRILFLLTRRIQKDSSLWDKLMIYLFINNLDLTSIKEETNNELRIKRAVFSFLKLVDEKMIFNVIHANDPLFLVPYTAFNPNEYHNTNIFLLLNITYNNIKFHKLDDIDTSVWRERVWDVAKSNTDKNTRVSFISCFSQKDMTLVQNLE